MIYDDFINFLEEEELSKNTITSYMETCKQFFRQYKEFNKKNFIEFKNKLCEEKSPKTVNLRITTLNKYADFIGHPEYKVKKLKIQSKTYVENIPNDEDYKKLLEYFFKTNIKHYWMLRFLAGTGVRCSELLKIKKSDLKRGFAEFHSKGKERRILIPRNLLEESKDYTDKLNDNDLLFSSSFNAYHGKKIPLTTRGVNSVLRESGMKCGINKDVLHPHAWRHYFAIKMLKATGNNISLVSSLLGHSSIKTTAIYTMQSLEEQQKDLNECMRW